MFGYYETNGKKIKRELFGFYDPLCSVFFGQVFGKITEKFSTIVKNFRFKNHQKSSCIFQKFILNLNQRTINKNAKQTKKSYIKITFETDHLGASRALKDSEMRQKNREFLPLKHTSQ